MLPCSVATGWSAAVRSSAFTSWLWECAFADALVERAEDAGGALDLRGLAFDFDVVVFQMGGDAQGGLEKFQVFIERAEEFVDASGDSYGLFHQVGGGRKQRNAGRQRRSSRRSENSQL